MVENGRDRFDARAEEWARYHQKPLGRIRHEVIWSNLAPHLPDLVGSEEPPRILDVGGGSGELALQLALHGYRVCLLDYAPAMLDQARQAARALPDTLSSRLEYCLGSAQEASGMFAPASFDAIACHTVVDYLPQPQDTLAALLQLLREDGLFSLTCVNHHAEVLRQAWTHSNPAGALSGLKGQFHRSGLFEVSGQAYTSEELESWLVGLGLTITARCGVRCFADFVDQGRLNDAPFFDALLRLEKVVATLPPYSLFARYVHLIAHRPVGHSL
jgi:S-adenosylmethionine-dependent methyltransferase